MLGQSGAIAKRAPTAAGSGNPFRVWKTNIVSSSTAAETLGGDAIPMLGCWVTFTASVDCYIHFGQGSDSAASAVASYPMMAGVEYNYWIQSTDNPWLRVIRAGAEDGVLTRYRSNL